MSTKYEAEAMDRWRRETENTSPKQDGKKEERKKTSPEHREGGAGGADEKEPCVRVLRVLARVTAPEPTVAEARGARSSAQGLSGGLVRS